MDESELLALAEEQHGVVAARQLRALGGGDQWIRRRVASGTWERRASRVIRLRGTPQTPEQALMVAVLQAGEGAVASHESAAWLWELPGFAPGTDVIRPRPHGDVAAHGHRPRLLPPHHCTLVRGIPVTTLPRTLFDLAARLPIGRLARLIDTVVGRSPAMLPALHQMLRELATRGRPGIAVMRVLLAERPVGSKVPPTGVERRFEQLCANAGIRGLERQVDLGGQSWLGRVDYLVPHVRLPIEVDSELHHTSRSDRLRDARRDADLRAAGFAGTLRITEEDIWYRPWRVTEQVRAAIGRLERVAA